MILLALGSNMGDRAAMLRHACEGLEQGGVRLLRLSSTIETPALLPPDAPTEWNIPFLNQVLRAETAHTPEALLALCQTIEQALGRIDRGRWGPREIDIDVLCYHDELRDTAALTLPHPGITTRDFVLRPIAEIAPEWVHPLLKQTAREMLA